MTPPEHPGGVLYFDPYRIDLGQRLLFRGSEVVPLEPKAFDTLLALAEANGRLVTKEELLRLVWPDTFVEEGSVARNVSTLRRVLGGRDGSTVYIETIAKRGYRFVVPVRRSDVSSGPSLRADVAQPGRYDFSPHPDSARLARNLRHRFAATVAVLAMIAGGVIWVERGRAMAVLDRPLRLQHVAQLTSALGVDEFPAWSPDGRAIAYSHSASGFYGQDWDIWITQPGGTPRNRTGDYAGRDLFPSWAPDGSQIAFWSDRDGGGCYVMPAAGGPARRVASTGLLDPNPPQWSADARELSCVVGDAEHASLIAFSLTTGGVVRRLALPGDDRHMFVSQNPVRPQLALIMSSAGLGADVTTLNLVDTTSGAVSPLTNGRTQVWSPSWSPDGAALYFVSNTGGSADVWQQLFDASGSPSGEPHPVSTGVGIRNAALSRDGRRLAYSQGRRVANVWRIPILPDRRATWADAEQLTFDQAFVEFVDVSPDRRQLAISSDRSGSFDLFLLPASGGDLKQITSDPDHAWAPRWSPDGRTLAFYSFRSGNRDIWTMPATGGRWQRVTTNPGADLIPSWSPDGREIVHVSSRDGRATVWVSRVDGGEGRAIANGLGGEWSPDGRTIAFLWNGHLARRDSSGRGEVMTMATTAAAFSAGRWTPDGTQLLFPGSGELSGDVYAVRPDGTGEHVITDLKARRGTLVANSLATDGKQLFFSWEEDSGDLWIGDLAR